MIARLIGAFIFSFIQMHAMIEENIKIMPEDNYIKTARFVVSKLVEDSKDDLLHGFSQRFDDFLDRVTVLKEKNILSLESQNGLGVEKDNIYGLNGSLVGPCLVGLKYKIYTDGQHLENIKSLQETFGKEIFDFQSAKFGNFVWSESKNKNVPAVEISIKKEYQLFSDEFHQKIYPTGKNVDENLSGCNQYASEWNYLGGKVIKRGHGKEEIEKEEDGTIIKDHLKFGNVLLIPGISPITTQNIHSQLLAIATSCYLIKTVKVGGYKQFLNQKTRERFPHNMIGIENISDFDIVLKMHKKIESDSKSAKQLKSDYFECEMNQLNAIDFNNQTFKTVYDNLNKHWEDECKQNFPNEISELTEEQKLKLAEWISYRSRGGRIMPPGYTD